MSICWMHLLSRTSIHFTTRADMVRGIQKEALEDSGCQLHRLSFLCSLYNEHGGYPYPVRLTTSN